MSNTCAVGLVGAGSRGLSHLSEIYDISDDLYVGDWEEPWPENADGFPFDIYQDYATDVPDWVDDISHLKAEVVAVCDPAVGARKAARERCRACGDDPTLYESLDAFRADDGYDTVVVASPNQTHAEVVIPMLNDGLDVFCEKPLATTLADHDRIIDAADRSDGVLYVGFNMRHAPKYARLTDVVSSGRLGRLGMLSAHEVRVPFPRGHYYTQAESGGTLLEKDCHDFDFFNWVIDADPVRVSAFGGQQVLDRNTDVIDHANVIVEYENGVKGTLELCLHTPFSHPTDRRYAARGTDAVARTGNEAGTIEVFGRETRDKLRVLGDESEHGGADYLMWVDILRVLAGKTDPPATATDAKKAAAIAIGAEQSISSGRTVEIDEQYDLH